MYFQHFLLLPVTALDTHNYQFILSLTPFPTYLFPEVQKYILLHCLLTDLKNILERATLQLRIRRTISQFLLQIGNWSPRKGRGCELQNWEWETLLGLHISTLNLGPRRPSAQWLQKPPGANCTMAIFLGFSPPSDPLLSLCQWATHCADAPSKGKHVWKCWGTQPSAFLM